MQSFKKIQYKHIEDNYAAAYAHKVEVLIYCV